jgi:hypothetical protein
LLSDKYGDRTIAFANAGKNPTINGNRFPPALNLHRESLLPWWKAAFGAAFEAYRRD